MSQSQARFVWSRGDIDVEDDVRSLGGEGSGNFGHKGRPGEQGGSSSSKDLMSEYLDSRPKGAVAAGTPWLDENGNKIGETTDTGGSTGLKLTAPTLESLPDTTDNDESQAVIEKHNAHLEKLEDREDIRYSAIDDYSGDGFRKMNRALQQNPTLLDQWDEQQEARGNPPIEEYERLSIAGQAAQMQDAIDRAPRMNDPITVYRSVNAELNVGEDGILQMHGFQSASFDPSVAAKFFHDGKSGTLLQIRARRGLSLGDHSRGGEQEFVMSHESRFRVTRSSTIQHADRPICLLEVEQL